MPFLLRHLPNGYVVRRKYPSAQSPDAPVNISNYRPIPPRALFKQSCVNEFALNMGVLMAAVWHLTGMVVVGVERACVLVCR